MTTYYNKEKEQIELDIEYKQNRKKEYKNEIALRKSNNKEYEQYWQEVRRLEKELYELNNYNDWINLLNLILLIKFDCLEIRRKINEIIEENFRKTKNNSVRRYTKIRNN